jgi:hypothetical protein
LGEAKCFTGFFLEHEMGYAGIGLLFFFIFGVFVLHGGDLEPIIHAAPSELATIGGAAVSAMLIAVRRNCPDDLGCFSGTATSLKGTPTP